MSAGGVRDTSTLVHSRQTHLVHYNTKKGYCLGDCEKIFWREAGDITLPPLKAFHILFSFSLKIQYHTILCKIAQYFPLIICLCCLAKIWQWLCAKILSATYFFCMGLCIKRRLKSQKADKAGNCYQSASAQGTRFGIGQQIQASIIFSRFVQKLETVKKHVL